MKKILSMLLASCMLFAFTASAKMPTGMKYVVSGTSKTTATCDIIVEGEFSALAGLTAYVKYDPAKVTLNATKAWDNFGTKLESSDEAAKADYVDKSGTFASKAAGKYFKYEYGYFNTTEAYMFTGADYKFATVYFDVVEGQTLAEGDIEVVSKTNNGNKPTFVYSSITGSSTLKGDTLTISSEFNPYTPDEPDKPSFVIPEDSEKTGENNGIVDINTNTETGAYSVKVTAPIGKKAVIYIDGVAVPGAEASGTATKETTIKVAYEDVTDEVITYVVPMSSIYGAEDGIAAFGKGKIAEGVEYGIKFGGLKAEYKGITDYKFPAKGNVGGIFGVEVKDAPAGDYTAQAYVGDAMGAPIDFKK